MSFTVEKVKTFLKQLVFFIFVRPISRSLYRRINTSVAELLWLELIWLVDWWACIKINLYVDAETLEQIGKEHALVLCNHRSDIDWLIGWVMAQRAGCLGSALAIMIKEARYLPIIGWSMWFSDYIFLERRWAKDENTLKEGLKQLEDFPTTFWLALFVEGTRFNQENLEEAQDYAFLRGLPSPRNVLIPRTKKRSPPTLFKMFIGQSSEVNLQMRRHKMSELPETAAEISQWCQDLFIIKDAQLENYFTNGVFSDLEVHQIDRPIKPLIVVIIWFCLLGGFKLLHWFSMIAFWKISCFFFIFLVIATITMQLLTKSQSPTPPNKTPLQEQLIIP